MTEFTITRKTWLRGQDESRLHRPSDCMECCIGQILRQCGVPISILEGRAFLSFEMVDVLRKGYTELLNYLVNHDFISGETSSSWIVRAYGINDDAVTDDAYKERMLTDLFREHNMALTFVD